MAESATGPQPGEQDSGRRVREVAQSPVAAVVVRNMRESRRARKWTTRQLSARLREIGVGLPHAVIVNLENRRRADLTVDELYGLVKVFETTADYMATNTGPSCTRCQDVPPAGFSCMACGAAGAEIEEGAL